VIHAGNFVRKCAFSRKSWRSGEVSDGYGRNYLIPQKKALLATEKSLKVIEHQKRQVQQRMEKTKKDAEKMGQRIEVLSCTFVKTVGEVESFSVL